LNNNKKCAHFKRIYYPQPSQRLAEFCPEPCRRKQMNQAQPTMRAEEKETQAQQDPVALEKSSSSQL
jgi:hypothetical protein